LAAFDLDAQNPNLSPLQQMQLQTQRSWLVGQEVGEYEIINWSRALIAPAINENYIVALGGVSVILYSLFMLNYKKLTVDFK